MHAVSPPLRTIAASLALLASGAQAADEPFQCTNRMAETQCDAGQCITTTDGFTPVQLHGTAERIELCAYSGCWDGPVSYRHAADDIEFLIADLHDDHARRVGIMLDRAGRHAQVNFAGFALVMECTG